MCDYVVGTGPLELFPVTLETEAHCEARIKWQRHNSDGAGVQCSRSGCYTSKCATQACCKNTPKESITLDKLSTALKTPQKS